MAHYAFITDNLVTEVIVGIDENQTIEGLEPEIWYSNFKGQSCKRTSYNSKIRFHFAGIGYSYDENLDAFIPPKCHGEATLDQSNCTWICSNAYHTQIDSLPMVVDNAGLD